MNNTNFDFSRFNVIKAVTEERQINSLKVAHLDTTNQPETGILRCMPANNWIKQASQRAIPKMLFSEFWHEGEMTFFFSPTNLGKSVLAVQIANSISKGEPIEGFKLEANPQPVGYLDFELSEKQFEKRYSADYVDHYSFSDNFIRAELNPATEIPNGFKDFESYLIYCITQMVLRHSLKVLIIDNLTFLSSDNEKGKDALALMKQLIELKKKYDLSILVLGHTPKRDASRPITQDDLHGSKMLMNFCDSAFVLGGSQIAPKLRYLKQVKQRLTEEVHGSDNVCVCEIVKPYNFLKLQFLRYGTEWEHLALASVDDKTAKIEEVKKLSQQGLSVREIAARLNIATGTVSNYKNS